MRKTVWKQFRPRSYQSYDSTWWLAASRSTASYAYLIGTHTIGAFNAALPIAIVMVLVFSRRLYWIALLVSLPPLMDLSNVHQNRLNALARRLNERPGET